MANGQPVSILLIEDTADDERLALRALQRLDTPTEVQVARDGAEAISLLAAVESDPENRYIDLVLLDLKLPKVSGVEVLQRIRESKSLFWLPVIVLTSSDEQRDLIACYKLHCSAYVRKEVNYSDYMESMKTLLDFWIKINRTPALSRVSVGSRS